MGSDGLIYTVFDVENEDNYNQNEKIIPFSLFFYIFCWFLLGSPFKSNCYTDITALFLFCQLSFLRMQIILIKITHKYY